MHELIEAIRAAVAEGASAEARQAGAQACRTILTALEAEPGKPLVDGAAPAAAPAAVAAPVEVMPGGVPAANPLAALAGLDIDRALDLVIGRLRAALPEQERAAEPARPGLRVQLVPVPKGR